MTPQFFLHHVGILTFYLHLLFLICVQLKLENTMILKTIEHSESVVYREVRYVDDSW